MKNKYNIAQILFNNIDWDEEFISKKIKMDEESKGEVTKKEVKRAINERKKNIRLTLEKKEGHVFFRWEEFRYGNTWEPFCGWSDGVDCYLFPEEDEENKNWVMS